MRKKNISKSIRQPISASDSLLSTSSDPPGFEYGNATPSSFSLVTESNVIDDLKLDYLNLSNYSLVKKHLGLQNMNFILTLGIQEI